MDDDFISVWHRLKPCDARQADYIAMKMCQQEKTCNKCKVCIGEKCDIYTSSEEEAILGKYLIEQKLQ